MKAIILSLAGLFLSVGIMVTGDHLVRKTKHMRIGSTLIKIGALLFFIVISVWAAYGKANL